MRKIKKVEQVPHEQFDQHMRALVERRVSPSLAVTAVRGSDTVVARGYGWSDLEQGTNASAETIYLYCSMTKLFTEDAEVDYGQWGVCRGHEEIEQMIWKVPEVIEKLSEMVALAPGDIIMTGTPSGVAATVAGDRLECEIERVGKLTVTMGPPLK